MTVSREEWTAERVKELVKAKDALYHENVQLKFEIDRLQRTISDLNSTMDEMAWGEDA